MCISFQIYLFTENTRCLLEIHWNWTANSQHKRGFPNTDLDDKKNP